MLMGRAMEESLVPFQVKKFVLRSSLRLSDSLLSIVPPTGIIIILLFPSCLEIVYSSPRQESIVLPQIHSILNRFILSVALPDQKSCGCQFKERG